MKFFEIATSVALVMVSIPSGAAPPAYHPQFHSHSSQIHLYSPLKTPNSKNLPRSTVSVPLGAIAGRSAATHGSELDRLERQTANQLHAQSRNEIRPAATVRAVHSQAPDHASEINFSYHPVQRGR
jgi:hypothetical protein